LLGTYCAPDKECRGGECVPVIEPLYVFPSCEKNKWSKWKKDSCKSRCLINSKGVVVKRRSCKGRKKQTANCNGPYYEVVLCDDSSLCTEERKTIKSFISKKCKKINEMVKRMGLDLPKAEPGWQAPHDVNNPWEACSIYCRGKNNFNRTFYYAPRREALGFGIDPFFPDGTWCHKQNGQHYYCRQHYCLPENYSLN